MSNGLRLATEGRINLFETSGRAQTMAERLMERLIADGWLCPAPLLLALEFMASFIVWQQSQALHPAAQGSSWIYERSARSGRSARTRSSRRNKPAQTITPKTTGTINGSPIRTWVATAPPKYPVSNTAPRTLVFGIA